MAGVCAAGAFPELLVTALIVAAFAAIAGHLDRRRDLPQQPPIVTLVEDRRRVGAKPPRVDARGG